MRGLLDNPTEGSYRLLGEEVAGLKEKERTGVRKGKLGFVFQKMCIRDRIKIACTYLVEESHGLCQKSAVRVNIIGQPLSHENMDTHLA